MNIEGLRDVLRRVNENAIHVVIISHYGILKHGFIRLDPFFLDSIKILLEVIALTNNLTELAVEQLAPLIQNQTISPVELTQAVLEHAEKTQEHVNAYMNMYRDEALQSAKQAENEIRSGQYRGMYHGIPMGIKDNIFFKNLRTTMSSKIHKDFIPTFDATVTEKLREAGVIFTGKLSMHEYAMGITNNNPHYGPVHNPWNVSKVSGGSSGGSGAAVAVGSSVASIGTDTAGSIRIPSALCGIVGLKPTRGRVSTHGVFPLSWTMDHVGPMTKTVKDAAGLLEIITGYDEKDPASANVPTGKVLDGITGDVKDLVIGINEDFFFHNIDAGIEKLVRENIQKLVDQGARVEEVEIPAMKDAEWAGFSFSLSEASTYHYVNTLDRPEDFGDDIRGLITSGASPSSDEYRRALIARAEAQKDFEEIFKKVDVLISPTTPVMPSTIGNDVVDLNGEDVDFMMNIIRLTGPGNLTGLPSLSVPCGLHNGMPVGLQIMGPAFREDLVLNTGYAIEKTNPLQGNKPSIS